MAYNYLGDLYKKDIVNILRKKGFDIHSVHALNLVLEQMGIQEHFGNNWFTTDAGVKYTIYRSTVCNADAWHPTIVDEIVRYLRSK